MQRRLRKLTKEKASLTAQLKEYKAKVRQLEILNSVSRHRSDDATSTAAAAATVAAAAAAASSGTDATIGSESSEKTGKVTPPPAGTGVTTSQSAVKQEKTSNGVKRLRGADNNEAHET